MNNERKVIEKAYYANYVFEILNQDPFECDVRYRQTWQQGANKEPFKYVASLKINDDKLVLYKRNYNNDNTNSADINIDGPIFAIEEEVAKFEKYLANNNPFTRKRLYQIACSLLDFEVEGAQGDFCKLRRLITIQTSDEEETWKVLDKICTRLAGNDDYINNRIVVNTSDDRLDGTENEVRVYIYDDAESDPEITI